MRPSLRCAVVLTITPMIHVSDAWANTTWSGLRGPTHDGAVRDASLFEGDDGELTIGWKREIGSGYSSCDDPSHPLRWKYSTSPPPTASMVSHRAG